MRSHPMWVRGLKQRKPQHHQIPAKVAPYVGAWIETRMAVSRMRMRIVAPYVGAWIETISAEPLPDEEQVAPYVGAWIETLF